MASIYSQGHIALAATGGSNSEAGFYRQAYRTEHDRLYNFNDEKGNLYSFFVREMLSKLSTVPLMERAYFFQERLLSPRIVHFAHDMLFWECLKSQFNECGTELTLGPGKHNLDFLITEQVSLTDPQLVNTRGLAKVDKWHNIVTAYSCCKLSFDKDKLPALQGIAKMMQQDFKCAYYAGLWEDTFIFDLSWQAIQVSTTRNADYQAPSWSWASQRQGVIWTHSPELVQPEVLIKTVTTTPVGEDPMGEIKTGALILKGKCFLADLKWNPTRLKVRPRRREDHDSQFLFAKRDWRPDYTSDVLGVQVVTAIMIGSASWGAHFLILMQVNITEDVFERVGYATISRDRINTLLPDMQEQTVTIV